MHDAAVVLLTLALTVAHAWGQAKRPVPPSTPSPAQPTAGVPRQLTLERADEILLQTNLAILAARYGVNLAPAQRPDVVAAQRAVEAAQRTLNQTRVASNQAYFDYRMSLYQLELATGRTFLGA